MMSLQSLNQELGNIDLYLLDQVLKGNIAGNAKILDAGCGEGRNLVYFMNNNYDIYGLDQQEDAIRMLQFVAKTKAIDHVDARFKVGDVKSLPYESETFDWVISSAVMHFADTLHDFESMLGEIFKVLKPGGKVFIRMASSISIEHLVEKADENRYFQPDQGFRFLLTRNLLDQILHSGKWSLLEPWKIIRVADQRTMAVLILEKVV
jgi:tellurite methyltransferase